MQRSGSSATLVGSIASLLCSIKGPAPHWWVPALHFFAALRFQRRLGVNRFRCVGATNASNQISRGQSAPSSIPAACPEGVSELHFGSKMPLRSIQHVPKSSKCFKDVFKMTSSAPQLTKMLRNCHQNEFKVFQTVYNLKVWLHKLNMNKKVKNLIQKNQ